SPRRVRRLEPIRSAESDMWFPPQDAGKCLCVRERTMRRAQRSRVSGGGALELDRGVDDAHMTEGLREVAKQFAGHRIDLLGQQPDIVGVLEQVLVQLAAALNLASQYQVVDQPEAAQHERAFA